MNPKNLISRPVSKGVGISVSVNLEKIDPNEAGIIRHFAQEWYISHAGVQSFRGNSYVYAFIKPSSIFTNTFQLEREVLLFFNPKSVFDPQSLDFVDYMISKNPNRLDRLCSVLVSRDNDITGKISKRGVDDPESRIIVPFTYLETGSDWTFENPERFTKTQTNRFKSFFFTRDLFAFSSPLRNVAHFFGRKHVIGNLYNKYHEGENVGLFGLRKVGKTSVLFAIKRRLEARDEPCVFFDCQSPAIHTKRWYELLQFIVEGLIKEFDLTSIERFNYERRYNENNATECFEEDLKMIWSTLKRGRLLIILDEIEHISFDVALSTHWAKESDFLIFWQSIRSVFQQNQHLISFIIAGVSPKCVETAFIQGIDNPIFSLVNPVYLEFFNVRRVKEMVSYMGRYMGLQFDDEVYTHLAEDYGGHPFLIRQVCSFINENITQPRPYTVRGYAYKAEKHLLDKHVKSHIKSILEILKHWYPDEYELLEDLAIGDHETFNFFVQQSPSIIEHLDGYGLVHQYKDQYYFRIKVVQDFIKENVHKRKRLTTKVEKWQAVTTSRNKLETTLRQTVKRALKAFYGADKGKDVFLMIISPPARQERLRDLNMEDLFGDSSELYFEDLRKVMIRHWTEFGKLFSEDRFRFEQYMQFVNKHRIDAHAKDLNDDDVALLQIACTWLQNHADSFLA
jgi:hypothetical protein